MRLSPSLYRPRLLAAVGAALALYALAGFVGVPWLVRTQLLHYLVTARGRAASIEAVRFNPFTLRLGLRGLRINDDDGSPMLSVRLFSASFAPLSSVWHGSVAFGAIGLDELRLNVVRRSDQRLNLLDLAPTPTQPKDKAPKALPRLRIATFALRDAQVGIVDRTRPAPLTLQIRELNLSLKDFSTRSEGNAYALTATTAKGEEFVWHGTFGLAPLESQGDFALTHLQTATLTAIAGDQLPLELVGGELDLHGDYALVEDARGYDLKAGLAALELRDIALRARGGAEDYARLPSVALRDARVDLRAHRASIAELVLQAPQVNAYRRRDGGINLVELRGPPSAQPPPAGPGEVAAAAHPPTPVWQLSVPSVVVRAANLKLEDRGPVQPVSYELAPVDITLQKFLWPATGPVTLELTGGAAETTVKASGTFTLAPFTSALQVDVHGWPLAPLQPYLDAYTKIILDRGALDLHANVDYPATGAARVTGNVRVDGFHTRDKRLRQDFISWQSLAMDGIEAHLSPFALRIREVTFRQPYARLVVAADSTTNVGELLGTGPDAQATPAPAAPPPVPKRESQPIEVARIRFVDGSTDFADYSVQPNFASAIGQLNGAVEGLSGRIGAHAKLHLEGSIDRFAPVVVSGEVEAFSAGAYSDIAFSAHNMELTTLSPYSGKFAGYRIEKGKLSVDFNYHIVKRQLNARHHIVVDQLQLGEQVDSPHATHLPIKLAIALLKDQNGVIDLDLPVTGSLDDPDVGGIAALVWKVLSHAIENVLVSVVTAPFKLLGSLFGGGDGGGGAELDMVDFAPAGSALDATATKKLATLKQALKGRPALKLEIPLVACADLDAAALAESAWQGERTAIAQAALGKHGADAAAVDALLKDPKRYRTALELRYRDAFGKKPEPPAPTAGDASATVAWLEDQLRVRTAPGPTSLEILAEARAEAIEAPIIGAQEIDPARLFVVRGEIGNCAPATLARLKLNLR